MSNVINDVKNVGATFSSWDSCMSKTYCKWPVIAAIIVGSLIALSVLWCIISCLCCGLSLCSACASCLTCGHCCTDCGKRRRRKDPEYHPMPPTPTPYQGYQAQSQPMMFNNGAQFATFDAGSKRGGNIHEDSLPAMPSWSDAQTRRVEDHTPNQRNSDVEMERMLPHHGPVSPVHDTHHASDLGTQRIDQQRGLSNDYYDPAPLSPAPTYYSTAPVAAVATAPSRNQYSPQHDHYNSPYTSSTPYPASRESTQFASQQSYQSYQPSQGVRPPSLLQIGRKPVAGSYREV